MRHRLIDLVNGLTVLSGANPGRKLLTDLIAATPSPDAPTPAFLDFDGIEVATASFLREAVIGFRDYARLSLQNVYPVAANLSCAVREELEFFVRARGDAIWSCDLDVNGTVTAAGVIGDLDPAQRAAFDAAKEFRTVTAPELAARFTEQSIGATAWNNRLSTLAAKGLLVERRQGKSKTFSPLLEMA